MRKFYSSLLIAMGICTGVSAQFTGMMGPTNAGGVNVIPATGGVGTIFTLTQATNHFGQAKGVWRDASVNLSAPFSVCANLNFGSFNEANQADPLADWGGAPVDRQRTGADGIVFVLAKAVASGGPGAFIGETGEEIGYGTSFYAGGLPPNGFTPRDAFGVEFDTWQNDGVVHGARNLLDPIQDHMAFVRRGSVHHGNTNGIDNSITPVIALPELETGAPFLVKFTWNPATGLSVDFNNGAFLMSATAADVLAAIGSPGNNNVNVNWGFNSGTGQAANLQTVQVVNCVVPPPPDCGQGRTQTMGGWGQGASGNNPGSYRDAHFASAFPAGVTIGLAGRSAKWTSAAAVEAYLPAGGPSNVLPAGNLVNPTTGQLKNNAAGQVLTLSLSVGFDDADPAFSPSGTALRDYIIASGPYAGMTVGAFLAAANTVLGSAGSTAQQVSDVQSTAANINENFVDGTTDNGYLDCPLQARPIAGITNDPSQPSVVLATSITTGAFPNPSRGQFRFNLSQADAKAQILIVNSRGSIIERRPAGNSQTFNFDLKKYGVGVYMIKVVSGNDIKTTKVIVQE
jgi:hypothetical protein